MENKNFKHFSKSDPDLFNFFFKAHQFSKKEKKQSEIFNYAFRQLKDEKGIQGVRAIFQHIPAQKLAQFEEKNPSTVKRLFRIANDLISGKYGQIAQEKALSVSNDLLQNNVPQKLLILDYLFYQTEDPEKPEILEIIPNLKRLQELTPEEKIAWLFSENPTGLTWPIEYRFAVEQLLQKNLTYLTNPSHLSVDLLMENNEPIEKSIKVFEQIKNPNEKSKSLAKIVQQLISKNKFERALETVRSIKVDRAKTKPLYKIIDSLLNPNRVALEKFLISNQVDQAIKLAQTIENKSERAKLYQKIAQELVKNQQLDMAKQVVNLIPEEENREYVLSTLVNVLSNSQDYRSATQIARELKDPDYRIDAYGYIVKSLLDIKEIDQAIAFVESIENIHERSKIAKILLSSMIAHHDPDRVSQIREKFELSRQYHGSNL